MRTRLATVWVALGVTALLAACSPASNNGDRRDAGAAPSTTAAAPTTTAAGQRPQPKNLLANASFEADLSGWRPLGGAALQRVGQAMQGRWGLRLAGTSSGPGLATTQPIAVQPTKEYGATVWTKASRPGATIRLDLVEIVDGRAYAKDAASAPVGAGWRQVSVAHMVHKRGARLELTIVATGLDGSSVLLDDVAVFDQTGLYG